MITQTQMQQVAPRLSLCLLPVGHTAASPRYMVGCVLLATGEFVPAIDLSTTTHLSVEKFPCTVNSWDEIGN